jgi:hypothetical protein
MRVWLRAAVLGAVLASSQAAMAGDAREDSRAAFRRGVQQLEANDYAGARDSFVEAYRLFPHPSILLNLGIARAHTGEYLDAEQDLIRFLADDGGAPANEIASAHAQLADVRKHLGTLKLRVAPGGAVARIDARPIALIPGKFVDVRATVGTHAVHVEAQGHEAVDRNVAIDSAAAATLDLTLAPTHVEARGDGVGGGGTRQTVGYALVGGGVVLAALGVVSGLRSKSLADDYNTPNSGAFQDSSTKSSGIVFRTLADAAFAAAVVTGGIGVYLLVSSPSSTSAAAAPQARVVIGPAFSGIHLRW